MAIALPVSAPKPVMPLRPGATNPLGTPGTPATPTSSTPPTALGMPATPQAPTPIGRVGAVPMAGTGTPYAPGVNTYATNPNSDLRGQTITPGPMANRMDIAQTYENNWNTATQPQYQADLRSATSQAAGAGQLGSGQLRTSLGNLAYNRDLQRNTNESNFLNTALSGSIEDAYRNIQQADQQQQFQAGLQGQTFNQGLQSLLAGNSGNPADTQLALSQMYGGQAGNAYASLPGLFNNGTQAAATDATTKTLRDYLQSLGGGGAPAQLPTGTPIFNTGTQYGGVTG